MMSEVKAEVWNVWVWLRGTFRFLPSWMDGNLAVSHRPAGRRAAPQEETPPSVSMSSLWKKRTKLSSAQMNEDVFFPLQLSNSISTSGTFVLLWLHVLRLSWPPPVQLSLHEYGNVVVLLLQFDGVHHWSKADVHQMDSSLLQHFSVSTFLPGLPFREINKKNNSKIISITYRDRSFLFCILRIIFNLYCSCTTELYLRRLKCLLQRYTLNFIEKYW